MVMLQNTSFDEAQGPICFAAFGDPVSDILTEVPYEFLSAAGIEEPGGCVTIEEAELKKYSSLFTGTSVRIPGGSAANVAKGLANLGLGDDFEAQFFGMVGKDEVGGAYGDALRVQNVAPRLLVSSQPTPSAQCLSLVTPDGQRTMRTFLGAASQLTPKDLGPEWLDRRCTHLHMEGYTLYRPELARAVLEEARRVGARTSLDLASFELVRLRRAELQALLDDGLVDLVFCNEEEAAELVRGLGSAEGAAGGGAGEGDLEGALNHILRTCEVGVITLGEKGCVARSGGDAGRAPACRVDEVVDTTGAGDTFCAGFLHGYLRGAPLQACCASGCSVGSEMVQVMGASLPHRQWAESRTLIDSIIMRAPMMPPTPPQM